MTYLYTASQNKIPIQSLCDNFGKYGLILIILSLLHSAMNSGKRFYIIRHLTSNLLPHYLVKIESFNCRSIQNSQSVQVCNVVQSRLFSVNVQGPNRDHTILIICLCRFIHSITACVQNIRHQHTHALSHAYQLSMDVLMTHHSMPNQAVR